MTTFHFTATLWEHRGEAAWHFVTLPHDVADVVEELTAPTRKGFGSVRVEVSAGSSRWRTSLFPDTKVDSYVLPMKRSVRRAEDMSAGDRLDISITLVDV